MSQSPIGAGALIPNNYRYQTQTIIVEFFYSFTGAVVLIIYEDSELLRLCFSTEAMRIAVNAWPEILKVNLKKIFVQVIQTNE